MPDRDDTVQVPDNLDICHVFVSRREEEEEVIGKGTEVRQELVTLSAERLCFWDMSDIEEGEDWRDAINRELEKANLLLLVLTKPAQKDFDWPIYEAGRYSGLPHKVGGKTICLYPAGETMPDTLNHIQGVEAVQPDVVDLLLNLYHKTSLSGTKAPLNKSIQEKHVDEIAEMICDGINGRTDDTLRGFHYINPYVQLILKKRFDKISANTDDESALQTVFKDAEIVSNDRTLRTMFGLGDKAPDGEPWKWRQLEDAAILDDDPKGFNVHWMRELEAIMEGHLHKKNLDRQIESGFLAKDGKVWQPEIEKFRWYSSGRASVDVTFSPQPHRTWMKDVDEPAVGLSANLIIANRIRQEVIEEVTPLLAHWKFNETAREDGFEKFEQLIYGVERDGYFIGQLTHNSIARAFEESEHEELERIHQQFREQIAEPLHSSLAARDVDGFENALQDWNANNAEFLQIGLRRYQEIYHVP